jgi:ribosomal protein S18 acetylase RimI-like enzyme
MPSIDDVRLDNPVYAALSGAQAGFAQSRGRALRYRPNVAPFFGLPPEASVEDWADAEALVAPGTIAAVIHGGVEAPEPWRVVRDYDAVQMVGERVSGTPDLEAVPLGPDDVPEMLELVAQTDPGPFLQRTVELGRYLGIRRDGLLAAMAGERFHLDGWREISAVCTAPTHRGQGLASRLMGAIIDGIQLRSERAFLHVLRTNTNAIRLYKQLGFRVRRGVIVSVMTAGPLAVGASDRGDRADADHGQHIRTNNVP